MYDYATDILQFEKKNGPIKYTDKCLKQFWIDQKKVRFKNEVEAFTIDLEE